MRKAKSALKEKAHYQAKSGPSHVEKKEPKPKSNDLQLA
jgi:hypothetical protein